MHEIKKKILFVSYGGGHSRMLGPVISYIQNNHPTISCTVIGLTTAFKHYKEMGFDVFGYKDFFSQDAEVLKYGKTLQEFGKNHVIDEEETVCYLGASFRDLVKTIGYDQALNAYIKLGRACFYQYGSMEKIVSSLNPNIIVTTNSPRSEQAVIDCGKNKGIPTLSLVDLFGISEFNFIKADVICVPFKSTKKLLVERLLNTSKVVVTGSPNLLFHKFPCSEVNSKRFLWCDTPAYLSKDKEMIQRSNSDIVETLDALNAVCNKAGLDLIARPHPSQEKNLFIEWGKKNGVHIDNELDIKKTISKSKVVCAISSTALVEAAVMGKFVIKYADENFYNNLPLENEYSYMKIVRDIRELDKFFMENGVEKTKKSNLSIDQNSIARISDEIMDLLRNAL